MRLAAAALLLATSACAPAETLNRLTPDEGTARIAGLAYAEGPAGTLDLYLPPGGAAAGAPVLVFFPGGGWRSAAKEDYRFLGSAFAARGWVVAIPDYRQVPEVTFPAFIEDGAAAVAALPGLLAAQGVAPGPLVLAGHSAGAHTALMLALDARWLSPHGLTPCRDVAAVLGLAGPYAIFPTRARTVVAAFGPAPQPADAEPIFHAGPAAPPAVLFTGADDTLVSPRNSRALAEALTRAGARASFRAFEGIGHLEIVGVIALPLRHVAPVLEEADAALRNAIDQPRACA
jgi:acetyl esterase/lipase